jgi:hypothetical protein
MRAPDVSIDDVRERVDTLRAALGLGLDAPTENV